MKLSVSNIAWDANSDEFVFDLLRRNGFSGIEIAPTRLVGSSPYSDEGVRQATSFCNHLRGKHGLQISSMQSIWFGIDRNIFGSSFDREFLLHYTIKAILFASKVGIPHLVFGCPKNRVLQNPALRDLGHMFFKQCAAHAREHGVVIGLEANPTVYGTNYLNTTEEVLDLVRRIDSANLRINYDLGAAIINSECLESLPAFLPYISHVHISEPMLEPVRARVEHSALLGELNNYGYDGWVSIEMKNAGLSGLVGAIQALNEAVQ